MLTVPFTAMKRKDFSEFGIDTFAELEGITIFAENKTEIGVEFFKGIELRNKAVLVHRGWAKHWNTERYFEGHPFLTREAADYLREQGVKLVGIDSHIIDDTRGNSRPVHTILLGAEILIVDHLCNLHLLPADNFLFSAVPPKFKGVGSFPVRAYARVTD